MDNILNVFADVGLRTTAVYLLMIAGIVVLGKKELSQLSIIDLVFVLLISNSVQNAMVGDNTTLAGGLISGGVLFFWNYILKLLKYRFPVFNKFVQGEPVMLVYDGKIQHANLKKVKLTKDELFEALREHGLNGLEGVELAVLENDGNVSVIAAEQTTLKKKKLPRKLK